jgi:antitoxin ParD1/3/4
MLISLPPDLEAFAQEQVDAGKYSSIVDVLADAIRALIDRQSIYQGRYDELRRDVQIGIDALERGEHEDLDDAIDKIRNTMRQRYSAS